MDPVRFAEELLRQTDPAALVWVVGGAAFAKYGVDAVKHFLPNLKGNVLQTLTAVVAIVATIIQAAMANVFAYGVTSLELRSMGIVAFLIYASAVGLNETLKNQNKPALPPAPSEGEMDARKRRLRESALERGEPDTAEKGYI